MPTVSFSNLTSVYFLPDGQAGWAVGTGGAIVETKNAGGSWTAQISGVTVDLRAIQMMPDGLRGWAVGAKNNGLLLDEKGSHLVDDNGNAIATGDAGTILHTEDGGKTWKLQASGVGEDLVSLQMLADGRRGWIVGGKGTILHTENGGKTWALQVSGTSEWLQSIQMSTDGQQGWVLGDGSILLYTIDGGKTWMLEKSGDKSLYLTSMQVIPNGLRGWIVGEHGTILYTEDGGRTWSQQKSGIKTGITCLQMLTDGLRGWAVGEAGTILYTSNGGKTWSPQFSNVKASLTSVQMNMDGVRGWIVGSDGTILHTDNGGKNWIPQTSGINWFQSLDISPDAQHVWIVGSDGTIICTKDGGQTWDRQASGINGLLKSVQMAADEQHGWIVGDDTILNTNDGGKTWKPFGSLPASGDKADSSSAPTYNALQSLANGQRIWIANGTDTINYTDDGGKNWKVQYTNISKGISVATFNSLKVLSDGEHGWVVGEMRTYPSVGSPKSDVTGVILYTNDGGDTWTSQAKNIKGSLQAMQMTADGQRGWVVGDAGQILCSEDGGQTWNPQTSGVSTKLLSVEISTDGQRGWIVGEAGTILYTKDRGQTWSPQSSGIDNWLLSIRMATDGQRGWAVGEAGRILYTNDGGDHWQKVTLYRRAPAPAYFFFLAFAFVPLGFALRQSITTVENKSIADTYLSDSVLTVQEAVGTQAGAVAAGLASYIENPKTKAPLVIGITGPWGSGKSSLMSLLRKNLDERQFQTAWFNAWHHQTEEHLFASLLTAIRGKALPAWWAPRGMLVRARLLRERFKRMWGQLLLSLAGIVYVFTVLPGKLDIGTIMDLGKIENLIGVIVLPAAVLPVVVLWRVFTAFNVNTSQILELIRGPGAERARASISLRQQFSEEFGEVTRALEPRSLTIFIDDLDRCQPDQMMSMLEVVNFLASSGGCYIVLSMEEGVVMHCLEEKLKDFPLPSGTTETTGAKTETLRARLWIEKLIQLRLHVAPLSDGELQALLNSQSKKSGPIRALPVSDLDRVIQKIPSFAQTAMKALMLSGLIGVVCLSSVELGLWTLKHQGKQEFGSTETQIPKWTSQVEIAGKVNNTDVSLRLQKINDVNSSEVVPPISTEKAPIVLNSSTPPKSVIQLSSSPASGSPSVIPGQESPVDWKWIVLSGFLVAVGGLWVLAIRDYSVIEDSETFTKTLNDFTPCIKAACPTPRAVKQLVNRIRLYAMLLRHWNASHVSNPSASDLRQRESDLVVFGILEKLCPKELRVALEKPECASFNLSLINSELSIFNDRASAAIRSLASEKFASDFQNLRRAVDIQQ